MGNISFVGLLPWVWAKSSFWSSRTCSCSCETLQLSHFSSYESIRSLVLEKKKPTKVLLFSSIRTKPEGFLCAVVLSQGPWLSNWALLKEPVIRIRFELLATSWTALSLARELETAKKDHCLFSTKVSEHFFTGKPHRFEIKCFLPFSFVVFRLCHS